MSAGSGSGSSSSRAHRPRKKRRRFAGDRIWVRRVGFLPGPLRANVERSRKSALLRMADAPPNSTEVHLIAFIIKETSVIRISQKVVSRKIMISNNPVLPERRGRNNRAREYLLPKSHSRRELRRHTKMLCHCAVSQNVPSATERSGIRTVS